MLVDDGKLGEDINLHHGAYESCFEFGALLAAKGVLRSTKQFKQSFLDRLR